MIENLLMAFQAFARHMLTFISVDEKFLPRYVNWTTNFKGLPFRVVMAAFYLKLMNSVLLTFK